MTGLFKRLLGSIPTFSLTSLLIGVGFLMFSPVLGHAQGGSTNPSTAPTGNRGGVAHSIRGKVFMPSGSPAEHRIRVVLELTTGGIVGEVFTDTVGNFEFRSLSSGVYKITVPGDNQTYETSQETMEIYGSFSRTFPAQVYLREKGRDQTFRGQDRILSVADLQEVPKDARKIYEKGVKRAAEDKPAEAAQLFEQAVKIFPEYLHALNKLGEQRARMGKFAEARAAYESAVAISPKFALAQINLGILLVGQKQFEEAIQLLESGNRLDDSYPMGHLNLGLAFLLKAEPNYDRAEKELLRTVELGKTDFAQARLYLFNLYKRNSAWDKAVGQLEAYLKEAPLAQNADEVRQMLSKVKKMISQNQPEKP
ncbi:MAG: tetratricopeptide repeat protein [Blastocatellia bacterium]|nr:tetratricopeptide repeat protein [Blastocatellia bacterium]